MKRFEDGYQALEIELVDINGKADRLKVNKITAGKLREIDKINKSEKLSDVDKTFALLELFFGRPEKDFENYTVIQLKEVIQHIGEYIKNPSLATTG